MWFEDTDAALMRRPDAGVISPFENFRWLTESEGQGALTVRRPELRYRFIPAGQVSARY